MIRIGIFGYSGRMGRLVAEEIATSDACVFAGGMVRKAHPQFGKTSPLITSSTDQLIEVSDMLIDFTTAEATPEFARHAAAKGKPFISGTTGLSAEGHEALKEASAKIPVLYAPNTSLSLVAMKRLTELAAKLLSSFDYDVAILDEHHRAKKDAPSGTAKALGEAVQRGSPGKKPPDYAVIRAGAIVGEHEVIFAGTGETIRLHHSVTDRRIFARGAMQAALWLHGKPPGLYGMEDVLGIK